MRVGTFHDLAVHLQNEAQHAVRRGVLGAEVDGVVVHLQHPWSCLPFGSSGVVLLAAHERGRCVMSSGI